jgi:hypothetical protein
MRMKSVRCEQAVEELDRRRALSNGGRHALDGTVSNVAGRKDRRHARLEEKRISIMRPSGLGEIRSREDETPRIPGDLTRQPLGVGARADHQEEPIGVDGLLDSFCPVTKHQVLEPTVAPTVDDVGTKADPQIWRRLHLPDQVMRHPRGKRLGTYQERDAPGVTGEVQRSLAS